MLGIISTLRYYKNGLMDKRALKSASYIVFLLFPYVIFGQGFVNSELSGPPVGLYENQLPFKWLNVPFTDPICLANSINPPSDSPDLCSSWGPSFKTGVNGTPKVGKSFVSGLLSSIGPDIFHEGIMQELNGLQVGKEYTIEFYQSVVKQINSLDETGSWAVYGDNVLLGKTAISTSKKDYNEVNLDWDFRTISFTASKEVMWIKFMPDDDDFSTFPWNDTTGTLRMGIDDIRLSCQMSLPLAKDSLYCGKDELSINLDSLQADSYMWNNDFVDSSFVVTNSGTYVLEVVKDNCVLKETIKITLDSCNQEVKYPNVFVLTPGNRFAPTESIKVDVLNFQIFSRWGMTMFESTKDIFWDGKYNFTYVSSGVYYWNIQYRSLLDGSKHVKNGFVHVLNTN